MARLNACLRTIAGATVLALMVSACSAEDAGEQPEWGHEAVAYFDQLTVELADNDFYGVLDFYSPSAYIEKWRGDLRGGARVAELLRWNSGDLEQEINGLYLGGDGAISVVTWASTNELGAVVSTVEDGRITGETVFDLASILQRSLRATPEIVSQYDALYFAYAQAWSSGDPGSISSLYEPDARVRDQLASIDEAGVSAITSAGSPGARLFQPRTDNGGIAGPALYLGPSEYGQDPGRAIGVFEVEDDNGCRHSMAVVWLMKSGLIVDEARFHEIDSYPACSLDTPTGWWDGLSLPAASDEVVTGVLRTKKGQEIDVRNGTPVLEQLLVEAMERYELGGLPEPTFDAVIFEPSRSCVSRSGRVIQQGNTRELYICLFESDLCPGIGPCQDPNLSTRLAVLHELAHAWILDHVDSDLEVRLVELVGLAAWLDEGLAWAEQGVEYSADVVAWGLMDEPLRMVRIGSPTCEELKDAFRLLTGTDPINVCSDD